MAPEYLYLIGHILDTFFKQLKQTCIDSANQTGSSVSIWTTNDKCFLAPRARFSAP